MSFTDALAEFVQAFTAEQEASRRVAERTRQCEAEIKWCRKEIAKEEIRAKRQPRAARRIAALVHEIRHREIEIAFL